MGGSSTVVTVTYYLEVMFLMQLSENIHDGHSPRILGSENLWIQKYNHAEWFGHFPHCIYRKVGIWAILLSVY